MDIKARRIYGTNLHQSRIGHNNSIDADVPNGAKEISCSNLIIFVGYHISSHINFCASFMGKGNPFCHFFKRKISCSAPKTIGVATNINSISAVVDSCF